MIKNFYRMALLFAITFCFLPTSAQAMALTLDLNGVAGTVYEIEGDSATIPEMSIDFGNDYTLKGWNTKPDGTGKSYKAGDVIKETTTLYAEWDTGFHLLVPADKTELSNMISSAKETTKGLKTENAYSEYQDAITKAEDVLNNELAEQDEVNEAITELSQATETFASSKADIKLIGLIATGITAFLTALAVLVRKLWF